MTALKITKGRQRSAARVVIYGTEGIGKSTLAAAFPNPLVLDTEDGTKHLDVARVVCDDWRTLTLAVTELAVDAQGYKSVVIDSADWAEKLLIESMLAGSGKKSIEDYGFGKGYTMLQEHVSRFLASCDKLIAAGLNVVFVGHSKVVRTSPPDMSDGFDRYELKLTKQVSPLLKEWCDLLVFCNYKISLVEGADGRKKATGGKERAMFSQRTAAWDAKNRYGLPDEMPMGIESLRPIFGAAAQPTLRDRIAAAETIDELDSIGDLMDEQQAKGRLTDDQAATLAELCSRRHAAINQSDRLVADAS